MTNMFLLVPVSLWSCSWWSEVVIGSWFWCRWVSHVGPSRVEHIGLVEIVIVNGATEWWDWFSWCASCRTLGECVSCWYLLSHSGRMLALAKLRLGLYRLVALLAMLFHVCINFYSDKKNPLYIHRHTRCDCLGIIERLKLPQQYLLFHLYFCFQCYSVRYGCRRSYLYISLYASLGLSRKIFATICGVSTVLQSGAACLN